MPQQGTTFANSVTSFDGAAFAQSLTRPPEGHVTHTRNDALSAEEVDEGRFVHPDSRAMYQKCGPTVGGVCRYFPIFGPAVESYGPRFIFTLDLSQFLSKGIAYSMIAAVLNPMFKRRFHATTLEYQRYSVVSRMGWSIKPFTALLSDLFAIFGFKKRWILSGSSLVGFAMSLVFAFLPATHDSNVPGAVMAFLVGYGQANIDILSEGLYARKIRAYPAAGPDLVSSVWVVQMIAGIIGYCTQGPLTDAGRPQVGLIICGSCMVLCFPFFLLNWMEEDKNRVERMKDAAILRRENHHARPSPTPRDTSDPFSATEPYKPTGVDTMVEVDDANPQNDMDDDQEEEFYIPTYCGGAIEFNKEVVVRNWRITVYCIVMTCLVVATALVTLLCTDTVMYVVTFGSSLALSIMLFWALPLTVAKAGLFAFLNCMFYIDVTSPMEGFLLENDACDSSYPQFTQSFYNIISGVVGNVAGLVGVIAFSFIFSKHSYRLAFIVTTLVYVVASFFDIIIVQRWNIDIGIPDHYMYIFGDGVVYQFAYMLNWMPMCILLAQLCPRGSEAMVYALLAAFSNYGQTVAGIIGELLIAYVWKADTETCQFDELWKLILFGHCGLPSLQFILVFFLIPRARVCDELNCDGETVPSKEGRSQVERSQMAPDDAVMMEETSSSQ